MKILVLTILKRTIFEAFFRPSTLKTEKLFKKNLMVAYVHIEYSTYQFSEESKGGGGGESTPLRPLRYRKKRGPERVNLKH